MKRLLIALVTLLVLALATSETMAQQRQGKGGFGPDRGSRGSGIQT